MKVLIIDDMFTIRLMLKGLLDSALQGKSPVFLEAEDGAKGLECALREKPDLIICDYQMPKLDGISLCRRVRASPELAKIPLLLVTSKSSMQAEATAAGASAFVSKPIRSEELEVALRKVLPV